MDLFTTMCSFYKTQLWSTPSIFMNLLSLWPRFKETYILLCSVNYLLINV